ncbi:hypothetical protein [Streptomyces anulatus]|uniref:hypothetical protein n=1 Tax=Streptomyces anulatus TaxID=1892 RepID=UPI0038682164|nr:hypothetical protein OG536_38205 [Streptomyces anulatus]
MPDLPAHRTGDVRCRAWLRPAPARYRCAAPARRRTAPGPRARPGALALTVRRSPPRDHPAPAPAQLQGEPFPEALSEAAQATGMSVRLILAIAGSGRANAFHSHPTPVPGPAVIAPTPSARASAAVLPAPGTGRTPGAWAAPAVSADGKRSWGPLTENLSISRDLGLRDRSRALQQLRISEAAHTYFVAQLCEHLPERKAAVLVSFRQWPLLDARMRSMDGVRGIPLAPCAAAWRHGPPSETAALLLATHHALTAPHDQPLSARPATAARSRSTTAVPDAAAPKQTTPEPAALAHRQQTAPAPWQGRGR